MRVQLIKHKNSFNRKKCDFYVASFEKKNKIVFIEPVNQFDSYNNDCRSDNNCNHCTMK